MSSRFINFSQNACLFVGSKKKKKSPCHQSILPKQKDNPRVCTLAASHMALMASKAPLDPHICSAAAVPLPFIPQACLSAVSCYAQCFGKTGHLQILCWYPARSFTFRHCYCLRGHPRTSEVLNSSHVTLEQLPHSLSFLLEKVVALWKRFPAAS